MWRQADACDDGIRMRKLTLLITVASLGSMSVLGASACATDRAAAAPVSEAGVPENPGPSDAAIGKDDAAVVVVEDAAADVDAAPGGSLVCKADAMFPGTLPVPEASSAAEVELRAGVREILVVGDSGRAGAALAIEIVSGAQRALTLPLDAAASDDLEGMAWRSGKLYTLTSSGAVRRFTPDGTGNLVRDQDAYALGAVPYACADLTAVNCGKNYEGLCLRAPGSAGACVGYAASKAEGKLYCLTLDAMGRLVASTTTPPLSLGLLADQLSDCAFGAAGGPAAGVLAVTTNIFGGSKTYRVDEATGARTQLPIASLFNVEATAIDRDGTLYVFDDNNGATSSAARATCVGW
jgi:hypothetical protein